VCDFLRNCEYRENLFFEIMLDCLENLRQNYKKLDKILAEFDIWKFCLTQTCHRKRGNCKVSIGVKDIKVEKKITKKII
jgi:hypothetical protein